MPSKMYAYLIEDNAISVKKKTKDTEKVKFNKVNCALEFKNSC